MSSPREVVLGRIRDALRDAPAAAPIPRGYHGPRDQPGADLGDVDLFAERVADYRAHVHQAGADEVGAWIATILADRGHSPVLVADGLPSEWIAGVTTVRDDQLSTHELDAAAGVLTGCAVAIAETGTIVLDHGPGQGRRALTLVPDYHLVVVRREQIRAHVPDAIATLDPSRPLTWISGPSATSDIELNRVEGVHGPRTLDVLIVR